MKLSYRGLILATLSVCALSLGACSTTSYNRTNADDARRVDSILQRAANEARANGNTQETVVLLGKIYDRNKDDPAIATAYGQALREDDQLNRARQVLSPFTQGKKPYPDALTELSMVQLALGQYKEAESTSRRALGFDEKSGRSYLALGTALDAQNKHEAAEEAFRKGIENWKGDPTAIMNNLALNLASQNKLDQAIAMLVKAKSISPNRVELERNLRIIRTLQEGADDYILKKQGSTKKPVKATPKKTEAKPSETKPKADEKTKKTP